MVDRRRIHKVTITKGMTYGERIILRHKGDQKPLYEQGDIIVVLTDDESFVNN